MTRRREPDATDILLQRFLDQDLTADERVALLTRLGRDGDLRARLIALEELARDAARLPPARVPPDFVTNVLARTVDADTPKASPAPRPPSRPEPSTWRRIREALFATRELRWNLATALALGLAAVLVGAFGLTGGPVSTREPAAAVRTGAPEAPTVLVRLVVLEPGATTVQVAGDFNAWNPTDTPLEPAANGAWTVTLPLSPGRYEYMFVVDGEHWIADPFAVEHSADGFGAENAVLDVRPPREGTL